MHKGILAKRNMDAQRRIAAASNALASQFGLTSQVSVVDLRRDPEVRSMKQREDIADLLELVRDAAQAQDAAFEKVLADTAAANTKEESDDPAPDPPTQPAKTTRRTKAAK